MAFQRFIEQREIAAAPKVTIQARGLIDFNEGATRKFVLSRFNYAVLFYDQETNRIGIQFVNNSSERGTIKIIKKPNGIAIPATFFLRQHNLLRNLNVTYNVAYSGEHDMYIIQLASDEKKAALSMEKDKEASPGPENKGKRTPRGEDKGKRAVHG